MCVVFEAGESLDLSNQFPPYDKSNTKANYQHIDQSLCRQPLVG
jgi:hypothetical protein